MSSPESSALAALHIQAKKTDKAEVTCFHCGKSGHIKEKCYRLTGFPPNFKFTKSKPGYGRNASSSTISVSHNSSIFSVDHQQHLTSLLRQRPAKTQTNPWIVDTGATDHMVCSTAFLSSITYETEAYVQLPNGTRAQVTHIGTVRISDSQSVIYILVQKLHDS